MGKTRINTAADDLRLELQDAALAALRIRPFQPRDGSGAGRGEHL